MFSGNQSKGPRPYTAAWREGNVTGRTTGRDRLFRSLAPQMRTNCLSFNDSTKPLKTSLTRGQLGSFLMLSSHRFTFG
jgi:hypothetical protein